MKTTGAETHGASLRRRVHVVLDYGTGSDALSLWTHRALIALVFLSVAAGVLETEASVTQGWGRLLRAIEFLALGAFSVEYLLRLWSVPEHTPYTELHPWAARWRFVREPRAIVDLLSVLPLILGLFFSIELTALLLFRLMRFFKLARYSPGMRSLATALRAERRALGASALLLFGLVLVTASAIHFFEHAVQPDKFGSIPLSMWWAIVTLTTVGYGDVVPVTLAGRIVAGFTMLMGLMMLALPIGIVATAFAHEIHRREFVVTWGMLARVPLFSHLAADEIAEMMRYLRAQTVPAGSLVLRRGQPATCMYFIADGEVEIDTPAGPVRLGEGHFFGEIALLRRTQRTATVRTVQATKLLVLDAADVEALMERDPVVRARIEAVARERSQRSEDGVRRD